MIKRMIILIVMGLTLSSCQLFTEAIKDNILRYEMEQETKERHKKNEGKSGDYIMWYGEDISTIIFYDCDASHRAPYGKVALRGPVFYRWMYPTKRNIQTLKSYVRNMNRPEGSIAEGYLGQECMNFYIIYLNKLEIHRNWPMRNQDDQYKPIDPVFESIP